MRVRWLASVPLVVGLLATPLTGTAASPDPSSSPAPAAVPGLVLAPDARIGADPPLRDPVQPTGRVLVPDLDRPADLDDRLKPVWFQIWFPDGTAGPGDTLRFHVRVTNLGKRTIRLYCPGFNLGSWTLMSHEGGRPRRCGGIGMSSDPLWWGATARPLSGSIRGRASGLAGDSVGMRPQDDR